MTYDANPEQAGWTIHRVAQGILSREGKVLISGNRWFSGRPLVWTLPGGRAVEGEGIEEALVRELYEETGLKVRPERLAFVVEAQSRRRATTFLTCAFEIAAEGDPVLTGDSGVEDLRWAAREELGRYIEAPSFFDPLDSYMASPTAPARYWFFPEYDEEAL